MQVNELLTLAEWFQMNIVDEQIPTKYSTLHAKINQNTLANQPAQPFETEKEDLYDSIKEITFQSLSLEQLKFLEQLEITELLGVEGVNNIEFILHENTFDIATVAQKIIDFTTRMEKAQSVLDGINNVLIEHFDKGEDADIPDDNVLMRIYFQNDASVNNILDLKRSSAAWYEIGRGIAMANDQSPEEFKVIGGQKGSFILEMAVLVSLATAISSILLSCIKVADRAINLLKTVEELKGLKLNNKKIASDLKKEAEKEKERGVELILKDAIKELKLNQTEEGDKVTALEKSVKNLVEFTQNGGVVDFVQPEAEEGEQKNHKIRSEMTKLNENISEIRLLESKIKLLEADLKSEDN